MIHLNTSITTGTPTVGMTAEEPSVQAPHPCLPPGMGEATEDPRDVLDNNRIRSMSLVCLANLTKVGHPYDIPPTIQPCLNLWNSTLIHGTGLALRMMEIIMLVMSMIGLSTISMGIRSSGIRVTRGQTTPRGWGMDQWFRGGTSSATR